MSKLKDLLREAGVDKVNVPRWTPEHPHLKGVVVIQIMTAGVQFRYRLVRFGNWAFENGHGSNASKHFWDRNHKMIAKGKVAADYWAFYYLHAEGALPWAPGQERPSGNMIKGRKP